MNGAVYIVGLGASTPIGRTVWTAAAAARAGVCGFSNHPYMVDSVGEPIRVARAPWLDVPLETVERYCELLFPAIDEAIAPLPSRDAARLGLALCLPAVRPGRPPDLASSLAASIGERYGKAFLRIVNFESGHAAGHFGLDAAVRSLTAASIDACVVAGVDSYLEAQTLEWVEACDQLNGAGRLNNAWGFIPGEAAGALLMATAALVDASGVEPLGQVIGVGLGLEANLIKTETVCVGAGLTQAFRAALSRLAPGDRIDNVFCDLNGEAYRADEYGFTALRVKDWFRSATDFAAPADCWGDVGAAGVPLHVSLGLIAHRKRYGHGPLSMICGSSESGERGAVVIRGLGGREG